MKKLSCLLLTLVLVFSLMMGCSKKEEGYQILINKLLSPQTYTSIKEEYPSEEYFEALKKGFGDHLDDQKFISIISTAYRDVIIDKNITAVKDLKISDIKNDDKSDFNYISCTVTYVYTNNDGKSFDMEDRFAFHVNKDDKTMSNIWVDWNNNSIFKLQREIVRN
ncbi:MAG: hypothetical protein RSB70_04215 [Clostridium sp.]